MKIRSSFTHPEGVSKLYEFYFFCWTQKKIFWRMLVTKQFLVPIDFHCIFFPYYGSQWGPATIWLPTFFKKCCVQQKTEFDAGLEQLNE